MLQFRPREEKFDSSSSSEEDNECSASNGESEEELSDVNWEEEMEEDKTSEDDASDFDEPGPSKKRRFSGPAGMRSTKTLYGKNRYKWTSREPEPRGRKAAERLVTHLPGLMGDATSVTSPIEAWSLLMPDELLNVIVSFTNVEISLKRESINDQTYTHAINLQELKAFLGLLYFSGVNDDGKNNTTECGVHFHQRFIAQQCRVVDLRFYWLSLDLTTRELALNAGRSTNLHRFAKYGLYM